MSGCGLLGAAGDRAAPPEGAVGVVVSEPVGFVVQELAIGPNHACALSEAGAAVCWGRNGGDARHSDVGDDTVYGLGGGVSVLPVLPAPRSSAARSSMARWSMRSVRWTALSSRWATMGSVTIMAPAAMAR